MAREVSPGSRQAALIVAAVLLAPAVPAGFVNRQPEESAVATARLAELFLPWLEGVPVEAKSGTEGKRDAA